MKVMTLYDKMRQDVTRVMTRVMTSGVYLVYLVWCWRDFRKRSPRSLLTSQISVISGFCQGILSESCAVDGSGNRFPKVDLASRIASRVVQQGLHIASVNACWSHGFIETVLPATCLNYFQLEQEASEAYSLMLRRQFRTQQKCRLEKHVITALLFQNVLELFWAKLNCIWIWQHLAASDCISQDASQEISVQDFEEVEGFSEDRNVRVSELPLSVLLVVSTPFEWRLWRLWRRL